MGNVLGGLSSLVLAVLPALGADSVQPWGHPLVADVPLHQVHLLDGNEHELLIGILQLDVVPLVAPGLHPLDALEQPDAIIHVNHIVPGIQLHEGVDDGAFHLLHGLRRPLSPAENLVLLHHQQLQCRNAEARRDGLGQHLQSLPGQVPQKLGNAEGLVLTFSVDEDAPAVGHEIGKAFLQILDVAEKAAGRIHLQPDGGNVLLLLGKLGMEGPEQNPPWMLTHQTMEGKEDTVRGRNGMESADLAVHSQILPVKALLGIGQTVKVNEEDRNLIPQIIHQGIGTVKNLLVEQLLPKALPLDPKFLQQLSPGFLKVLVATKAKVTGIVALHRTAGGSTSWLLELVLSQHLLQPVHQVGSPHHLLHGIHRQGIHRLQGLLSLRVEGLYLLYLVKVKDNAVGHLLPRHENVQHLTSQGKFPPHRHPWHPQVALLHQPSRQGHRIKAVPHPQGKQQGADVLGRGNGSLEGTLGDNEHRRSCTFL